MDILLQCIDLKQTLDVLRPLAAEAEERIMQKFRLDWNYHSNHLEGNSLSYGETKALLLFGITAQGKPLKDHIEITGHNEAILWLTDVVKEKRPLTEKFIRELHDLLLKEPYYVDAITPEGLPTRKEIIPSQYKQTPNHVRTVTGEIFRFATPEETPAMMTALLDWLRQEEAKGAKNPVLLAAEFHYRFIRIHPFDDGNGRTARLLMNFILMKNGYPPVIIKTEDKENYFAVLRQADAGLLDPFITYIAQNLVHSLEIMISGAKGESIAEEDDFKKEIALLEQRMKRNAEQSTPLTDADRRQALFQHSIAPLVAEFLRKNREFESLYDHASVELFIDDQVIRTLQGGFLPAIENRIANLQEIRLVYNFTGLKTSGVFRGNASFTLSMELQHAQLVIRTSASPVAILKSYDDYLEPTEIGDLVQLDVDTHLSWIKEQINQSEN